jgi:5'-methylthioadenosine phosphorylase
MSNQEELVVGVIGGSGLYEVQGLSDVREVELSTPFGAPSDSYITGTLGGVKMVFLPRHGRGHRISPSELNFRANIWGMKRLGVTRIVSISAVGSMREDIHPGEFVVIDQFFDRTRHRVDTFFGEGCVAHVMFADPVCPHVRAALLQSGKSLGLTMHDGGAAVLHARRVPHLPPVGRRCDRHDQPAGSQARPRGGDLLLDRCDGDRLRLLA